MKFLRILLIFLGLVLLLVLGLYSQNYFSFPGEHATEIQEPFGDTVVTLEEYKVYDLIDVPFRFILADVKISNVRPINFELSRFQTDEGLQLNEIDEYRAEISRKGYDLGIQNVTTQLQSNENELNAKILIPVLNSSRQLLRVSISGIKTDTISFDLSEPMGSAEDLGVTVTITPEGINQNPEPDLEPENQEVGTVEEEISNTTQIMSAAMINKDLILYKGLEDVHRIDFGDRVRILLVGVNFDYEYDVTIAAARIYFPEQDYLYFALGQEYVVENGNNILNKTVRQENGSLIFQIDDQIYNILNQPYNIEVRYADSRNWVTIHKNVGIGNQPNVQ